MVHKKEDLYTKIQSIAKVCKEKHLSKKITVVSHFDTDGITSAAIMTRALQRLDATFSVKIVKNLEKEYIRKLPKNGVLMFLDLASGNLPEIASQNFEQVIIIDHHELPIEVPEEILMINPQCHEREKISSAGLVYLFCKEMDARNEDSAKLAILGMIGDRHEKEIAKLNNQILVDGDIITKRGPLVYPATRPLNRTLEYSENPYIPTVTGNTKGTLELLREVGISTTNGRFPSLTELDERTIEKLTTAIMLRMHGFDNSELIGDIFLIKLFNKLEDAREISAMINACSRLGESELAIEFCLEIPRAKKKAEEIHIKYKQEIMSALKKIIEIEKIEGKGYKILNAKGTIKDTIIGTVASILASSERNRKGNVIITMAHAGPRIKISARNAGKTGRNVREILYAIIDPIGGEVGGHEDAAGGLIEYEQETKFIEDLKKHFELEVVKI